MNRLDRRSRLLAVAGIVILLLSFAASGEKPVGHPAMPFALVLFSRTALLAFLVAATICLWSRARTLALWFAGINLLQVLASVMALTQGTLTLKTIPIILVHAPSMWPEMDDPYRVPLLFADLAMRVASFVLYIWVIVRLFRTKAKLPTLPADAVREEVRPGARARPGAVPGVLGTIMAIALAMLFGVVARARNLSHMYSVIKHPILRGMYAVQGSLESWAKENGGAYPYAAEFDSDSSRFMKFLARDRVG